MRFEFGNCVLDPERRELTRDGALVHTRAKVFDILFHLIDHRDRVVSRDELLGHVWPNVTVSDATLSSSILSVRRAIGDDGNGAGYITTLRGQGFRFVAKVAVVEPEANGRNLAAVGIDDGPAIAVLPFVNLNDDPALDYLADGLAEDITTELSRFKAIKVIARNSSFQFKGRGGDVRRIGRELRVDYILEGSVRRIDGKFRASAQLILATTAKHL